MTKKRKAATLEDLAPLLEKIREEQVLAAWRDSQAVWGRLLKHEQKKFKGRCIREDPDEGHP